MDRQDEKSRLGGFRGILSASVIVLLAGAFVWLAALCMCHLPLPAWLVNSRIAHGLAGRYGVSYSLGSLRVGCFPLAVEIHNAETSIELPERVRLALERVDWSLGGPLRIEGLQAGTEDQPDLVAVKLADLGLESGEIQAEGISIGNPSEQTSGAAETLMLSLRSGTSLVRRVRVPAASRADAVSITVEEISASPPRQDAHEGWVHLGPIALSQVDVRMRPAETPEAAVPLCERIRESLGEANAVASRIRASEGTTRDLIARVRGDLLLATILLAAALFGMKLLVTLWFRQSMEQLDWLRSWFSRLLLRAAPVLAPLAVSFLLTGNFSFRFVLLVAVGASISLAAVLWWTLYRHAAEWYQKWEPAAIDVAGFVIVPLLALHGYNPTLPSAPGGLSVERVTAIDTSVAIEAERCADPYQIHIQNPETTFIGIRLPLPVGPRPIDITVTAIEIPSQTITIRGSDDRDLFNLSNLAATVNSVHATLDLGAQQISDAGAAVEIRGAFESIALRRDLQRVRFLREQAGRLTSARFIAAVDIGGAAGTATPVIDAADLDRRQTWLLAQGVVSLDTSQCTFQYDTNVRVLADAAKLSFDAAGESGDNTIRVASIHSLVGSQIGVASGNGAISLDGSSLSRLRVRGVETAAGQWQAAVDSVGLQAALSTSCSPSGGQSFAASFERAKLQGSGGYEVGIPNAEAAVRRSGGAQPRISFETHGERIAITGAGRVTEDEQPWLSADVPRAEFRVSGRTSSEFLPRSFEGEAELRLSRPETAAASSTAFGVDAPVRFSADVWEGLINVPGQTRLFRQTVVPRLPAEIGAEISLRGVLGDFLTGNLRIPHVVFEASLAEVALNDITLQGQIAWEDGRAQPSVTFRSGWNRVRLPELPRSFRLDQIAHLDLETKGSIQRLPLQDNISFGVAPPSCPSFPALPQDPFRIAGAWPPGPSDPLLTIQGDAANAAPAEIRVWLGGEDDPDLRLTYGANTGIRIGSTQATRRRITLPSARLESADLELAVEGIRTLDRLGDLRTLSGVNLGGDQSGLSLQLGQAPASDSLLGVEVGLQTGSIGFNSTQEVLLSRLMPALDPFIQHWGCNLGGVTLAARVPGFSGRADFSERELSAFDLGLRVGPGPLGTLRADTPPASAAGDHAPLLRSIELTAGSEADVQVRVERSGPASPSYGALRIATTIPALTAEVVDREGNQHRALAGIKTHITGSFYAESTAPANPLLEKLNTVARDLNSQARKAVNVFGNVAPETSGTSLDLDWDVSLTNDATAHPVADLSSNETVRIALRAEIKELAWRIGEQERSRLVSSSRLRAASQAHSDHLVVEGQAFGPIEFSREGSADERYELSLPLAVAFRDELRRAPDGQPDWLWDRNYYEDFWHNYPAVLGRMTPQPLLDLGHFTAGSLSLKQLLFPLGEVRLAVGHASNLQLHVPVEGRLLFGEATGLLQTDIGWAEGQAVVTTRGEFSLADFQAAALGLASQGRHVPFVEDELTGRIVFRADRFPAKRNSVPDLLAGLPRNQSFEGLDLDLRLSRSRRHADIPGIFQLSTQTELTTLNNLLGQVAGKVRLSGQLAAMLYRGLDFRLTVENGQILTEPLLLDLRGAELFSSEKLEVGADLRVHWQKKGQSSPQYNIGDAMRWLQGVTGPREAY